MRGVGGHIVERVGGDGRKRYLVKVEGDRDPATGRRQQYSAGTFRTKRQAQQRLAEVVANGFRRPSKETLAEFLREEWLASKNDRAPATRSQYAWAVGHIVEHLGRSTLSGLTPRQVQEFHAALREAGLSARSRQMVAKTLRAALALAVTRGYLSRSPAAGVATPSGERASEIRFWTKDEARAFLAAEATRADRLYPLWFVVLNTGLRRGELCALRWVDLDLNARRLSVRQAVHLDGYKAYIGAPKTKAARRVVGLDDATVEVLRRWRTAQQREAALLGQELTMVFCEADGSLLHPQTLAGRLASLVRQLGVPEVGLHGLRHTHATLALEAGVPLKVVSERLGHTSIQITADTYQHALEHLQHDAADAIGALLSLPA